MAKKKTLNDVIERLKELGYREVTEEELLDNVKYTLEEVEEETEDTEQKFGRLCYGR